MRAVATVPALALRTSLRPEQHTAPRVSEHSGALHVRWDVEEIARPGPLPTSPRLQPSLGQKCGDFERTSRPAAI